MDVVGIAKAAFLGIVEGLTEFIPVSSTGHLLLLGELIGFSSPGNSFEVLIQLGAVLAIISVYFARLWHVLVTLPTSSESRRFATGIVIAFLPAAVLGALAHDYIKSVLFETPLVICVALVVGGILLLVVDRLPIRVRYTDVSQFPLGTYLAIGFFQCLALIPGTSRSGATIAGALVMGTDKRSAAEFSFFLAMPTMAGAFVYDLVANRSVLTVDAVWQIVVGFVLAFIAAVLVVKTLLGFVSRHGYAPFAWWRIGVGLVGIVALTLFAPGATGPRDPGSSGYEAPTAAQSGTG